MSFVRYVMAATRHKYAPVKRTHIVLEGFRREVTVNDLCRLEGLLSVSNNGALWNQAHRGDVEGDEELLEGLVV